ncbi:crotonase/enoyl-CoA hydratase family protein [Solicola gregarius]|uniref:Crotonase/enoyl-CoA hydratase family protein n=1 Tax=Solicola gregarius TaxID=2908642 RepID=A0AA46TFS1_9ACTN|nr:crotonase/enoyl-CoA hydratase family protein [Solicola gregarius]UYM04501.1 crotonase/enoyl-CoA hydratase family protein [Solicola gregarius]
MSYQTIEYAVEDGILTITLDRPASLNAFTVEMAGELVDAFGEAGRNDDVRAIVVTGAGRAFCAGMDLSIDGNAFGLDGTLRPTLDDMRERLDDPAIASGVRDTGGKVALAIYDCPKPVIAAINGAAVGIGATMTLPMDFRLASTDARIGFVFARIGIVPEACSTWFLPRLVGMQRALEWTYTGDILDAQEAYDGGLLRSVHEPERLLDEAYALAHRISDNRSAVGIAVTRQMMYRNSAQPHPVEAHRVDSLGVFYASLADGREGVQAFREKRDPNFESRVSQDLPPFYPWQE